MSELTILQKNGITNMVCRNEDCHTPEISCPCTIIDQCECPTLKKVIETLAYYRDIEEQGRLIEQKHGRWITETVDVRGRVEIMGHYCSNCEHYEEAPEDTVNVEDFYTNYCPNCGAKMDEAAE